MIKTKINEIFKNIPETLIILGSGINEFINNLKDKISVSYQELFYFETDTSIGHNGILHMGYINNVPVLVMEGRRHYYEGVLDSEMRMFIQTFAELGVKNLIVTNACGGMNETFKQGDIMLIEDHINMMGRNPLVGRNNDSLGARFVDMSEPYDIEYRELMLKIAKENKINIQQGVYVSYLGPSYETKAEIKAFRMLGGDVVGMSTVPEVIIARHAGIRVLGLSIITNMSTGISKTKLSHEEVLETSKKSIDKLSKLLIEFIGRMKNV